MFKFKNQIFFYKFKSHIKEVIKEVIKTCLIICILQKSKFFINLKVILIFQCEVESAIAELTGSNVSLEDNGERSAAAVLVPPDLYLMAQN